MADKRVAEFVAEARKRGFGDATIRASLLNYGWPAAEVEKAFTSLEAKPKLKNQITLFLDAELLERVAKRAKKNMFSVSEQIEDILRRSTISQSKKKSLYDPKLDDALISIFSRRRGGRKRK